MRGVSGGGSERQRCALFLGTLVSSKVSRDYCGYDLCEDRQRYGVVGVSDGEGVRRRCGASASYGIYRLCYPWLFFLHELKSSGFREAWNRPPTLATLPTI